MRSQFAPMDPNGRNRRKRGNPVHGWVVLDKPLGLGSTKAVGRVRWLFEAQKAGHAGTLDPLATGVLPIALGEATKTVPFLVDAAKAYEFDITFGLSTETLDAEGAVTGRSDVRPEADAIKAVLPRFIGNVEQVPPKYSAIKIDGKRAYDLARAGVAVEMKTRIVRIDAVSLTGQSGDIASFTVDCGKGTYVRSLARDICEALGAQGHVSRLRRTRVGPFDVSQSVTLEALEADEDRITALRAVAAALPNLPRLYIDEVQAKELRFGRDIPVDMAYPDGTEVGVFLNEQLVAIGACDDGLFHPRRVFAVNSPE
ncbi:tRNA pseudouridine(55) synthase TruB [Algimonas ampicilliniresistens]|nr:tRNA pseudouridine(55) synthase TruB [Algimonas ampicilliniresistens]